MKLRLAWLADHPCSDSYSAKETRVLLRAIARDPEIMATWFAVGSTEAPHYWKGVRVFPIPESCLGSAEFLSTLINQLRPQVILSNLSSSRFAAAFAILSKQTIKWLHRPPPDDMDSTQMPSASLVLFGEVSQIQSTVKHTFVPYLRGFHPSIQNGLDPTTVYQEILKVIHNGTLRIDSLTRRSIEPGLSEAAPPPTLGAVFHPPVLLMRQQLFCNSSWAQVMFELTNALLDLGIPTIAQDEQTAFARAYVQREEALYREGAPAKYHRVCRSRDQAFDPENAITLHFTLFESGARGTQAAVFPSLGREVLYSTGNHTVNGSDIRRLADMFEKVLAPSRHVLYPYLEAGLSRHMAAVIPHGVDPSVYAPEKEPFGFPTEKRFKFLQTSFPWVYEKGFDLTLKAFGRTFSSRDDVALILRVPQIMNANQRAATFGRLERLVREECSRAEAPEILLLEKDFPLDQRGGIYTGADCYVHPLRAEGFGMTILEAMACGLPVIATPWSGPADFLSPICSYGLDHSKPIAERAKDGRLTRFHVEPSLEHLAYLMRYVYEHRDEAKALGRKASVIARTEWTWKLAARKLISSLCPGYAAVRNSSPISSLPIEVTHPQPIEASK